MSKDWDIARALLGGTRAMRAAGKQYLPKWPGEQEIDYALRLSAAVLFPAYKRTVETLAGKPFAEEITLGDDVPQQLQDWMEDIDLRGRNLSTFSADILESTLGYGICGILIDYPQVDGIKSVADERNAGVRPYWVQIYPWQVLGWRDERVGGAWRLTQLRLLESVEEPDGLYGTKQVQQVRVLAIGSWQIFRQNAKQEWVIYSEGSTTLGIIPYVPVYGQRLEFMIGRPNLLEVAYLNIAHWQSASDQQTILHVARVPILAVTGVDDDTFKMKVGASSAVRLPAGGEMKFVEHTGKAIEAGAAELEDLEERMRQAGAELLVLRPGKITATQTATENAVGMSALHRIVQNLEDAIDQALQITAEWIKLPEGGHVKIFNDFGASSLAEASMQVVQTLNLSDETKFNEARRRGIVSPDIEWSEEKERLDAQGPSLGAMAAPGAPSLLQQQQALQDS
jgi:hypothetical protein